MASVDSHRFATSSFGFRNVAASIVNSVLSWNEIRQTRNSLSQLTDRELEDIGLCRGDIEAIANKFSR